MNKLINLIKEYLGKKVKQEPEGIARDLAKDRKEVASTENEAKESGFDPQATFNLAENTEFENRNEVVDAIFKVVGEEVTWKKPISVTDRGFISKSTSTRETEQGLERQVSKPLIVAACGKVISEEEIGIRCSVCNQYDCKEHAFLCNYCSRALCIVHTYFFKNEAGQNVPYCAKHYKEVVENQNTWELKDKQINKEINKNEA
jgi:hypothetical protein